MPNRLAGLLCPKVANHSVNITRHFSVCLRVYAASARSSFPACFGALGGWLWPRVSILAGDHLQAVGSHGDLGHFVCSKAPAKPFQVQVCSWTESFQKFPLLPCTYNHDFPPHTHFLVFIPPSKPLFLFLCPASSFSHLKCFVFFPYNSYLVLKVQGGIFSI